jgi:hypothetical protein
MKRIVPQGVLLLTMALSMVRSLRMQAMMTTLGNLPACWRRWANARMAGLQRMAVMVAM